MSALAKMLLACGYPVRGYDAVYGRQVQILRGMGVKISVGETAWADLSGAEIVVYTDAVDEKDERLSYARREGKWIMSRADLLAALAAEFSRVIAVAGSHGKTTCTAMCAHALARVNAPFAAHIGGEDSVFDNFTMTGTDFFVTEACEYKKNLSKIQADTAIVLNIDKDHLECYKDEEELNELFFEYLSRARTPLICADDKNCRRKLESKETQNFITFGCDDISFDYSATEIKRQKKGYSFWVTEYGKRLCRIQLSVQGKHNVYNALAAFAALRSYGFDEREIAKGLQDFQGVKRRFERLGEAFGGQVIADYAHHPSEIAAVMKTAKESLPIEESKRRLYVIFQPHTFSRTRLLMEEFVSVLSEVENLVVYKTFAAREGYEESGSAKTLAERLGNAIYADNAYALEAYLRASVQEGDCLLFLGAGDIYALAQHFTSKTNG